MNMRRVIGFGTAMATLSMGSFVGFDSTQTVVAASPTVQSVVPARLVDTRAGSATIDGTFASMGRRAAGSHTEIQIGGRGNVPFSAATALINLTDIGPSRDNYLTVYPGPCGTAVPQVSTLNSLANRDTANGVFAKLGPTGSVCVYTVTDTNFAIDVTGYVPSGGTPNSVTPVRLVDTRPGPSYKTVDGAYQGAGPLPNGSFTDIKIAGRGNVPPDAKAAIINLTAVRPSQNTYLSVYPGPCSATAPSVPTTSSLNALVGADTANNALVQLGTSGTICVYTVWATDIVIDLNGYVSAGEAPSSVSPARLADTRSGADYKTVDGKLLGGGQRGDNSFTEIPIAGRGNVPTNATAAMINLTASQPARDTYLTAYPGPCSNPLPNVSTINVPARTDRANNTMVKLGTNGTVCVYSVYATDIVLDVTGYAVSPPSYACPATGTIPPAECQALVALYNNTNGINNGQLSNWLTPANPCTWVGITCEGNHVTQLNLSPSPLAGAIPPEIGALTSLRILNLTGYQPLPFTGSSELSHSTAPAITSLTTEIGALVNLTELNLSYNRLTSLPGQIANLTNLNSLALDGNDLSVLPPAIGYVGNLRTLRVSENRLTTVPAELGRLTNLTYLDLTRNNLTTPPTPISSLTKLTYLSLYFNELTGDVTALFTPLMAANTLQTIGLNGNKCLRTTNAALATWLNARSFGWNAGCR